ncbi:hypothetical protein CGL56_07865 [Neolewinella marina]|uniref:Tyr recombinase domain-containing protein n=2 Tax=Neolewinella marina TaxID=438751 RepID=A0A2G0CHC1_9BACT|nr:hypothetical protein CGL56_07865 [Neolewinella marina]
MTSVMAHRLPKVNFNIYNATKESGTVYLTMTVNGGRIRFAPGISVNPSYWDKKRKRLDGRANLDGNHARGINAILDKWEDLALRIYTDNTRITAEDLKERLVEERDGKIGLPKEVINTLDGFARFYVEEQKATASNPRNFDPLATTATYLERYAAHTNKSIYWREIDKSFARKFRAFLERKEFDLSHNQVANIFYRLRHIMKAAGPDVGAKGFHENKAYLLPEFKLSEEAAYRHYLNEDELAQFLACDLSDQPHLEKARDLFVLNAYTGLRRSDAKRVTRDHYYVSDKGNEQIKIYTGKSSKYVHIPLMPEARAILEKYDWKLPLTADQTYNENIKVAAKLAGLDERMTHTHTRAGKTVTESFPKYERIRSHDARRSFATNFYELGFPAALLMQITGHAREDTFFKYICTTPERAADLFAERLEAVRKFQKERATKKLLEQSTPAFVGSVGNN